MLRAKIAMTIAVALITSTVASAAQASVSTTVSWTILPFAVMSLNGGPSSDEIRVNTPLPTPSATDEARGYLEVPDAVRLTVMSNTRWTVLVQSLSDDLGTSDDGTFTWAVDALQVGVNGQFAATGTQPRTIASGGRGEHDLAVAYRAHLPAEGLPDGQYNAILLYTIITS